VAQKHLALTQMGWAADHPLLFHDANVALKEVIRIFGTDYLTYAHGAKDTVFKAVKYAQLVKKVIDTPILNEDGSLTENAMIGFRSAKECLEE